MLKLLSSCKQPKCGHFPSELVKATLTENFDLINVAPERADVYWIVYGQKPRLTMRSYLSVKETLAVNMAF